MPSAPTIRIFGTADDSPLLSEFLATLPAPIVDRSVPVAVKALDAFLNRAPSLSDLNAETMFEFSSALIDRGISPETADRYLHALRRVATAAVIEGVMSDVDVPRLPRWRGRWTKAKTVPWTAGELSKLFGAIHTLRGTVSGVPARLWWKALCLASIDVGQAAATLLGISGPAFDLAGPTLTTGLYVFSLRPVTAAAIAELDTAGAERLFPWELDESASAGGIPYYMLFLDFKKILKRAGLPAGRRDLFRRLSITGEHDPEILGKIDWGFILDLPHGVDESPAGGDVSMQRRRRRGKSSWAAVGTLPLYENSARRPHSSARKADERGELHTIANPSDRTIRRFFEDVYVPRRLAYGSSKTAVAYRATINRLREYCLTDCTLDALSDDLVETFLAFYRQSHAADSLKRMRGELLAIWRYAWRKRRIETQPRDIDEIRTPKRLAEAWSIDEIDRLLTVAGGVEGTVAGIPASLYWPALILFLIETGVRIGAAMQITRTNFDAERCWIRATWEFSKTRADQDIPISPQMVRMLLALHPPGSDREMVFPWPFKDRKGTLNVRLRALLRRAGLPCGRRDLWHRFRRTCATFTADVAGEIEAQKLLGHASISTTRKYLDVRKLRRARIVDSPDMQRATWKPPALLTGPTEGQPS